MLHSLHSITRAIGAALCIAALSQAQAATVLVSSYGDGTAAKANFDSAYAAASAGDTIRFPLNGSATWSASATVSKAVTIDGNGTTLTMGSTLNNGFFYVTNFTSTSLVRITGFTLDAVNHTSARVNIKVADSVELTQLRIDNNTFRFGYEGIHVGGANGVVDSNTFYNCLKGVSFTADSAALAEASWASMAAGTSAALFIEFNAFTYDASYPATGYTQESIGTYNGGKLVVRYNTVNSETITSNLNVTFVETHGSAAGGVANGYWQQGTGARRGQSVVEIYNNTVTGVRNDYLCVLRGSANLVWGNTLDTETNDPRILLREEEGYDTSNWNPLRTAWPAEDQVHNSHFWNNTLRLNGTPNSSHVEAEAESATFIQLNRDYWLAAPAASGGYEYFTGANGAAGSHPTDGDPYPTEGTMAFSASGANYYYGYTPYTYPHPLRGTSPVTGNPRPSSKARRILLR